MTINGLRLYYRNSKIIEYKSIPVKEIPLNPKNSKKAFMDNLKTVFSEKEKLVEFTREETERALQEMEESRKEIEASRDYHPWY